MPQAGRGFNPLAGNGWERCDPRQPMERLILGAYKVGGRRVKGPTGPSRDSSLWINKAPGNVTPVVKRRSQNEYSPPKQMPSRQCLCALPCRWSLLILASIDDTSQGIDRMRFEGTAPMSPTRI